jgi:hypothetical protein
VRHSTEVGVRVSDQYAPSAPTISPAHFDRRHHQAADERGFVQALRNARILANVGDHHLFAVPHRPSGDAFVERGNRAPSRGRRSHPLEVARAVAVAHHHRRAIRADVRARGACQHAHDIVHGVAGGERLHDLDDLHPFRCGCASHGP